MDTPPLQQCDVCGTINTTKDQTWIRIPALIMGTGLQPIRTFPIKKLDVCPTCAPKTMVSQLPGLLLPAKK